MISTWWKRKPASKSDPVHYSGPSIAQNFDTLGTSARAGLTVLLQNVVILRIHVLFAQLLFLDQLTPRPAGLTITRISRRTSFGKMRKERLRMRAIGMQHYGELNEAFLVATISNLPFE
jgi:hypothetical protein